MPWKGWARNTASNIVWEDKLTWFKVSSQYRALDTIDGGPMEFEWNVFPRIHHIAALQQSPRVPVKNERRTWRFHRRDHLHVDVQRHLMATWRQWTGMRMKPQTCFDWCEKIFNRKMVIPRDLNQKRSGIQLMKANHKENGRESLNWWWSNSEKADTQCSDPRVPVSPRRKNYQYTSALMRERLKLFFAPVFLLISSVSTSSLRFCVRKYSACQTRTERPVLAGQSDPLFEPAKFLMTTPTPSIEIPAQEDLLQKYEERVERLSQQNRVIKICTDAGFLKTVGSRTVLHDKAHWRVLAI